MIKIEKTQLPNGIIITCENDYRSDPVYSLIKNDFYEKCYICEDKEATSINIEHFISHEGNTALKYNYNNLFYSCRHCNLGKGAQFNNIINCINEDPEESIILELKPYPKEYVKVQARNNEQRTLRTVELLKKVYNAENTPNMLAEAEHLRNRILKELIDFRILLESYYDEPDPALKHDLRERIKRKISRRASFSAFKREVIRENTHPDCDLAGLVD